MFPSFIKTKFKLRLKFERELRKKINEHPRLPKMQVQLIHEGDFLVTRSIDGYEDKDSMKELQTGFEASEEEMIENGPQVIFDKIPEIVEDMAAQRFKALFNKMEDVTQRTGNVVDGQGAGLTPDLIMETLEKMDIRFDENGNPHLPTMYISPDVSKKMGENADLWKETPEMEQKMAKLIDKKRSEWNDRQDRRKLVS